MVTLSGASRRRLTLKLTGIRFRIAHHRFKDKLTDSHFPKQTYSGCSQIDHFERQWAVPALNATFSVLSIGYAVYLLAGGAGLNLLERLV